MLLALTMLILTQAGEAAEPGKLIASDREISTTVRVIETADLVRFDFSAPASISPSVAIDVQRNGAIDSGVDFRVGFDGDPPHSPCLQSLLDEQSSSECRSPGEITVMQRAQQGGVVLTSFSLPKRLISGDEFGFGFELRAWNRSGNYDTLLDSGDYQFGGQVSLVDGPNFMGSTKSDLTPLLRAAVNPYQSCLYVALKALGSLEPAKVSQIRAIPSRCAPVRSTSFTAAVDALIASGDSRIAAEQESNRLLDHADKGIMRFVDLLSRPEGRRN